MPTSVATYCRLCPASCGVMVDLDEQGDVLRVRGDQANALTQGFTCVKGRRLGDFHRHPARLRESLRRDESGSQVPVDVHVAIEEIAARLGDIIAAHGPDSVAIYLGTQAAMASLTTPFTLAFWKTIGSRTKYGPMSIDQAAKWVADGRLGRWAAGGQRFADADVWMMVGSNPLVSMQGAYTGFPIHDGMRRLDERLRDGLQLIVVDPRRTELAARATLHLQLIPGTDAALFAGLLRVLLTENLIDADFCARWVPGLADLAAAVAPFTPEFTADACGLDAADVVEAARRFGRAARGMVTSGTGPDMGPDANLAEHLLQTMNVVAGRFPRAGEPVVGTAVLGSGKRLPAQPVGPDRHWETGAPGPSGYPALNGEFPVVTLADDIRRDGPGKVRALIVSGGNPVGAVPGKARLVDAFSDLELLVTVDPFLSETAELADYVIAPVVHLERPDTTRAYEGLMDRPFAQYTPAVVAPPEGVIDDWEFFLRLAGAMGNPISVAGRTYLPGAPIPSTDEVLATFAARARVPLEQVKAHAHGLLVDDLEPVLAGPPEPDATATFDVAPADVVAEVAALAAGLGTPTPPEPATLLLIVRRAKEVVNSTGTQLATLARRPWNPCHAHPDDLAELGLAGGEVVSLTSDHGTIDTVVRADATLRRGSASMTHGFGGRGAVADPPETGSSTNRLLSAERHLQPISGMPHMTAVRVRVGPPTQPHRPDRE